MRGERELEKMVVKIKKKTKEIGKIFSSFVGF